MRKFSGKASKLMLAVSVSTLCASRIASADVVSFDFVGTVEEVFAFVASRSGVSVGDTVEGRVAYETSSVEEIQNIGNSTYYAIADGTSANHVSVSVSGRTFQSKPDDANFFFEVVDDNRRFLNGRTEITDTLQFNSILLSNFFPSETHQISFQLFDQNRFKLGEDFAEPGFITTDDLPSQSSQFSQVNGGRGNLSIGTGGRSGSTVGFSIESVAPLERISLIEPTSNFEVEAPTISRFGLGGDYGSLNPDAATVIITHGRQPGLAGGSAYTGNVSDIQQLADAYQSIKIRYGEDINVILVTWESAFVFGDPFRGIGSEDSFLDPLSDAPAVAALIAKELSSEFPDDYNMPLHLVGHSYGSKVNNTLAMAINGSGLDVAQMTVLDAPTKIRFASGKPPILLSDDEFLAARQLAEIEILENYYGTEIGAFGDTIPTAVLDGGFELPANHAEVFDIYVDSILNADRIDGGGFRSSVATRNVEIENIQVSLNFDAKDILFEVTTAVLKNATYSIVDGILNQYEGSDSYFSSNIMSSAPISGFGLVVDSLTLGADDWFEVVFNDKTVGLFSGETSLTNVPLFFDVGKYSTGNDKLTLLLTGNGEVDSAITTSGYYSYTLAPTAVPIPSSLVFVISSICALLFFRKDSSKVRSSLNFRV